MAAIFGPQNSASADHIRSITDVAEIPFIDTRWNMQPVSSNFFSKSLRFPQKFKKIFFKVNPILTPSMSGTVPPRSDYAINLHPDITTLSKFGQNKQFVFTSFSPIFFKTI